MPLFRFLPLWGALCGMLAAYPPMQGVYAELRLWQYADCLWLEDSDLGLGCGDFTTGVNARQTKRSNRPAPRRRRGGSRPGRRLAAQPTAASRGSVANRSIRGW